jgi:hypothetical protein
MEETLTVTRLGITGRIRETLSSTNPCEKMIEIVRRIQRNVKRWQVDDMRMRWTPPGCSRPSASSGGDRLRELGKLAVPMEREVAAASLPSPESKEVREVGVIVR